MRPEVTDKTKLQEIFEIGTVDTGTDTAFGVSQKRPVAQNRLTFVIGTGGSGTAVTRQVVRTAKQKLQPNFVNNFQAIVVDSASDELEELEKEGIDVLDISAPGIRSRLSPENRDAFYKSFVPRDLPYQEIDGKGAGRRRMFGKIKLYDQNRQGSTNDQLLKDRIAGLFQGPWAANKNSHVDVIIVTGISGGNGSGTFGPIAAIARQACPSPDNVTVYGYILLPDTAAGKYASNNLEKASFYANGFAALKELESFESFTLEPERRECFPSRNSADSIVLSASSRLIDLPVLVSGDYDEAVSMIAETIVNAIATSNGNFSQASFYSNNSTVRTVDRLAVNVVSENGILKNGMTPEDSCMYCGLGYSIAEIPKEIVVSHLIAAAAQSIYSPYADISLAVKNEAVKETAFCTREKGLDKADFEAQMRMLLGLDENVPLDEQSLWHLIEPYMKTVSQVRDNPVDISRNEIAAGDVNRYYAGFQEQAATTRAVASVRTYLRKMFDDFRARAKSIMRQYGPRAMYYLYTGTGNPTKDGKRENYSDISLEKQMDRVSTELSNIKQGIRPALLSAKGLIGKVVYKNQEEEWRKKARACTQQNVRCNLAGMMKGDNGLWETEFVRQVLDFLACVDRFAYALEEISNFYMGVGQSLCTNDYRAFVEAGNGRNKVNLCTDMETYAWVRNLVQEKVNSINIGSVRKALIDDFYLHTADWISNDTGKARERYDDIFSSILQIGGYAASGNGLSLDVSDYFSYLLEGVPAGNQQAAIESAVKVIYPRLITKSEPSLHLKQGTPQTINRIVLLPGSLRSSTAGPMIMTALTGQNMATGGALANIYYSDATDAIVCYQTSVANPLSALEDLDLWENAYEHHSNTQHLDNGEYPRLHMNTGFSQYSELSLTETDIGVNGRSEREPLPLKDEAPSPEEQNAVYGTGLSWTDYPSVNLARYADDFSDAPGTTESRYRGGIFAKRVKEAERTGLIECVKQGWTYKFYMYVIPKDWTNLDVSGYRTWSAGRMARGQQLFEYLKAQNPQSDAEYRKQICLSGSPFFGSDGFDFSGAVRTLHWKNERVDRQAEAYMMRILRKATELYQELEDTMYRFYGIEWELEDRELVSIHQARFKNFATWVLYGVITTDEDEMYWSVRTPAGTSTDILGFSRRSTSRMDDIQRRMLADGFRLKLVYDSFQKSRQTDTRLSEEAMNDAKNALSDSMSDREFDAMVDKNLSLMKKEAASFMDRYGNTKDPLDTMMNAYGVNNDQLDRMQDVIDFYTALGSVIEEAERLL